MASPHPVGLAAHVAPLECVHGSIGGAPRDRGRAVRATTTPTAPRARRSTSRDPDAIPARRKPISSRTAATTSVARGSVGERVPVARPRCGRCRVRGGGPSRRRWPSRARRSRAPQQCVSGLPSSGVGSTRTGGSRRGIVRAVAGRSPGLLRSGRGIPARSAARSITSRKLARTSRSYACAMNVNTSALRPRTRSSAP